MIKNSSLIGKEFNNLKVLSIDESRGHGKGVEIRFLCECVCGNVVSIQKSAIVHEKSYSCGCIKRLQYDLTGMKFNKLTVIKKMPYLKHSEAMWECVCDCGNKTIVNSYALRKGTTKSCGCLCFESRGRHLLPNWQGIHCARTNMLTRCYNEKYTLYHRYGGRGIIACDEWKNNSMSFYEWAISNGYSNDLTLDRIDNNGNYEPSNCRWATCETQSNNRHTNRFLTKDGQVHTMAEWARILDTPYSKIQQHIYSGKDFESYEA